jgi:hypothetical protein
VAACVHLSQYSVLVARQSALTSTTTLNNPILFATFNCCVTYIVTSYKGNSTVAITNLLLQTPCHFIDTGMEIKALVLTGNILLVMDATTIAAWPLTEEGVVIGAARKKRASFHDSIWTVIQPNSPKFAVKNQIAFIQGGEGTTLYIYSTETGDGLDLTRATLPDPWWFKPLGEMDPGYYHSHHENNWPDFTDAIYDGWIRDPDEKCQLWIPVKWRAHKSASIHWLHCVKTLWFIIGDNTVAIKF